MLGFDTSTAASAAAVLLPGGEVVESAPPVARLAEGPGHASELLPAVHDVLGRAGMRLGDVDVIAVGRGPGTFTGLRIGLATARALAKATGVPVRGVSSLAALAAGMPEGRRLPLIDAKRGEVYGALYDGAERAWAPFALGIEPLVERLRDVVPAPLAAGDGSLRFRQDLEAAGVEVAPPGSPRHVVSAGSLCRLALGVPDSPPEQVLPEYLRDPDAVPR